MNSPEDLPLIDTLTRSVAAGPAQVWAALDGFISETVAQRHPVVASLLGTVPASGFEIAERAEGSFLRLTGRHRFARYSLTFTVEARPSQRTTLLHATTHAAFPGVAGRCYRLLVIRTGLHVVATNLVLRRVEGRLRFT